MPFARRRPDSSDGYEFDLPESRSIAALARVMTVAASLTIVAQVLSLPEVRRSVRHLAMVHSANVTSLLVLFGGGAIVANLLIGVWTLSAAAAFRRAATTQGSDIANAMNALDNLRRLFAATRALIIAVVVVTPIALVDRLDWRVRSVIEAGVAGLLVLSLACASTISRWWARP